MTTVHDVDKVQFAYERESVLAMYVNMMGELWEAARKQRDATPWWRIRLRLARRRDVLIREAAFEVAMDLYGMFLEKKAKRAGN